MAVAVAPTTQTPIHSQSTYLAFAYDPVGHLRREDRIKALGRRVSRMGPEEKARTVRASKLFPPPRLLANGTAIVVSFSHGEDVTYTVDYGRRTCTCPAGRHGTLCHHWWQVHLEAEERAGYTNAQHRREEVA